MRLLSNLTESTLSGLRKSKKQFDEADLSLKPTVTSPFKYCCVCEILKFNL